MNASINNHMIDSATIRIPNFVTYSDKYFSKLKYQELRGQHGIFGLYATRYTDYPKQCKKERRYFPQVQIVERSRKTVRGMMPHQRYLVVQVSIPKLLFGTSIFDFHEKLLPVFVEKLSNALREIDIGVTPYEILTAVVTRLDYSKIIQIAPNYGTTDRILRALAPYDMKQSSDFNRRDYHKGRDGFYLKFYNSSQALVLYDKMDEIVANGSTNLEKEIARSYQLGEHTKGALRIELSLQKKQTVDAVVRRLSGTKKRSFTLEEVAKRDYAKDSILRVFESVYVTGFNRLVRLGELKDTKLLQIVQQYTSDYKQQALLYFLAHRIRDRGLNGAVEELKQSCSPATATRHKRTIETILSKAETKRDSVIAVPYLHRKLKTFRPVLPRSLSALLHSPEPDPQCKLL
jgi:hypothetical protein